MFAEEALRKLAGELMGIVICDHGRKLMNPLIIEEDKDIYKRLQSLNYSLIAKRQVESYLPPFYSLSYVKLAELIDKIYRRYEKEVKDAIKGTQTSCLVLDSLHHANCIKLSKVNNVRIDNDKTLSLQYLVQHLVCDDVIKLARYAIPKDLLDPGLVILRVIADREEVEGAKELLKLVNLILKHMEIHEIAITINGLMGDTDKIVNQVALQLQKIENMCKECIYVAAITIASLLAPLVLHPLNSLTPNERHINAINNIIEWVTGARLSTDASTILSLLAKSVRRSIEKLGLDTHIESKLSINEVKLAFRKQSYYATINYAIALSPSRMRIIARGEGVDVYRKGSEWVFKRCGVYFLRDKKLADKCKMLANTLVLNEYGVGCADFEELIKGLKQECKILIRKQGSRLIDQRNRTIAELRAST